MEDTPKRTPTWKQAFPVGILFEVTLIGLCFLLPQNTWLHVKVFNFLLICHFPLIMIISVLDTDSAILSSLLVLLGGLTMSLFWAWLFRLLWRMTAAVAAHINISRRQKIVLGSGLTCLCLAGSTLVLLDSLHDTPTPFTALPETKSLVEGNTAFAIDLYQKLKEQPGNMFFSPFSISTGFGVVYGGARGKTESELSRAFHLSPAQETVHHAFGELLVRMKQIQHWRRITLVTATSLWCQSGQPFTESFLNLARAGYHVEAQPVDFQQPGKTAEKINAWMSGKTHGKINDMIQPDQLTSDSKLLLCNAIYFKGRWASQFKPADTQPGPFSISKDEKVTVPMMSQKGNFKMAHLDDADGESIEGGLELLELPYTGHDLSMIILLPWTVEGLPELERELTPANLQKWLAKLDEKSPAETRVVLPRFTTSRIIDLKPLLSPFVPSLFNGQADLSGMDGRTNLYISDAIHQTFVEVDEVGTEAAAVTFALAKAKSMRDSFVASHPFIFLIRDNGSGSILFLGRMVDPSRQ